MTENIIQDLTEELEESKALLSSYDLEGPAPEDRTPSEEAEYLFHWSRINEIEQQLLLLTQECQNQ